jgi:ATP-dependent DNA ligase
MSVKGEIKPGAGFVKGEMDEHGKFPEGKAEAQESCKMNKGIVLIAFDLLYLNGNDLRKAAAY